MTMPDNLTLINPHTGNLAFRLSYFDGSSGFDELQRLNYYSIIWVKQGKGTVKANFAGYDFSEDVLLSFAPYQPFIISNANELKGICMNFHPDFFCIHKHQQEVACNGLLFNNIYEPPVTFVNIDAAATFNMLLKQMEAEIQNPALAQYELLISYLKIFLITASRLKAEQQQGFHELVLESKEPFILQNLKSYIEIHFKTKHSASDYADLLSITPKALAKLTKTHFNKTLTDLISERIVIEAKRELYLTNKQVKEIAYELGYEDEHYFSRFFKNNTDVSPQMFRETVGFGKAVG